MDKLVCKKLESPTFGKFLIPQEERILLQRGSTSSTITVLEPSNTASSSAYWSIGIQVVIVMWVLFLIQIVFLYACTKIQQLKVDLG